MVRQASVKTCIFLYYTELIELISTMDVQEIKSAARIHEYVSQLERLTKLSLKNSPIILGTPSKKNVFNVPVLSRPSTEYVEQLYEDIGNHDLLLQSLRTGWHYINSNGKVLATSKEKYFQQLNSSQVYRRAKQLGYQIPEQCFKTKQFCYGQYEAYSATYEIFNGKALGIWSPRANYNNFMHSYAQFYKAVKLVTSQFIVPSSGHQFSTPYIFDQLWVIAHGINQVRLLGLEVAGEHHFLNGGQSKTLGNEKYLEQLGYEMYHVASWWCRVDPYRVISELLREAGIFPEALDYLVGAELDHINKYVCGICCQPMVRLGWDWIQKCQIGDRTMYAHKHCVTQRIAQTAKTRGKIDVPLQRY